MHRRNLLLGGLAMGLCGTSLAQPRPTAVIDVVKIMSFSCSVCLASEGQDPAIAAAARATGGKFVSAPIPDAPQDPAPRERTYFAARDMDARFGETVKQSLYRGSQEAQVSLRSFAEVYYWMERDLPAEYDRLTPLITNAQGVPAGASLERAIRLTISSGVQLLPTYVLLADGRFLTALDRDSAGAPSLSALREAVITRITSR